MTKYPLPIKVPIFIDIFPSFESGIADAITGFK